MVARIGIIRYPAPLSQQLEAGAVAEGRIALAGGNRYATGIP
jgi:hypothetical protein